MEPLSSQSDSNEPRTCPACGMFYYEWLNTWDGMERGDEPLIPNVHECPEPYPRDVAESLARFHASSGIPVHPRTMARIRLGLES